MRFLTVLVCLALLVAVLGAAGCTALGGGSTGDSSAGTSPQRTTTAAPTTTTTLSPAEAALAAMTTRQKVAQVLLVTFSGTSVNEYVSALMSAGPPAGFLLMGPNVTDAAQVTALTAALQQAAAATGSSVGLLIAVDQEGGKVQRVKEGVPILPSARTLGTGSTPAAASELARETAAGLLQLGINMNLAPVADVVADTKSFLFDRSYASDPGVVSSFVAAVIQASQGQGLICVVKHFPGHGSAAGNSHNDSAVSQASREEFESVHLPPFRAAIAAGVEGVMISHVTAVAYDPENPASSSPSVVGDLLRGELGYQGLVMTDDLRMVAAWRAAIEQGAQDPTLIKDPNAAALARAAVEARVAVAALNAGCDLLVLSEIHTNTEALVDALVNAVDDGSVSQATLDEAVLKVLQLKFRHGLAAQPTPVASSTSVVPGATATDAP